MSRSVFENDLFENNPLDREVLATLRDLQNAGEPGFLSELVAAYVADAITRIDAFRAAIQRGDPKALYQAAHSLKGSSANLGARELVSLCAELEAQGRAGVMVGVAAALADVEAEFTRVRRALEAEL